MKMNNFIVTLCSDNSIIRILGLFRTFERAKKYVHENFPEFHYEYYQYSKFRHPEFIKIDKFELK